MSATRKGIPVKKPRPPLAACAPLLAAMARLRSYDGNFWPALLPAIERQQIAADIAIVLDALRATLAASHAPPAPFDPLPLHRPGYPPCPECGGIQGIPTGETAVRCFNCPPPAPGPTEGAGPGTPPAGPPPGTPAERRSP